MKKKIKNFFITLWDYICLPFLWLSTRKTEKKLARIAEENRAELLLDDKNAEFLKDIPDRYGLEPLQNECKKQK